MGTLSGNAINATYDKLIKFSSQNLATSGASFNNIEDGAGSASSLELTNQATGKVRVRTKLAIGSSLDPSYQLDIGTKASAIRVEEGGNTSLAVGNGHAHGFAAGDVNVAPGVGTSGAAQAYSNYIAIDPTAHSGKGQAILMNGDAAGAIGIGNATPTSGEIEIGADSPLHKIKFNVKSVAQALNIFGNSETLLSIDGSNKRIGLGENTTVPSATVEIAENGGAASTADLLCLHNRYWNASMNTTSSRISFKNQYSADTTHFDDAAWINAGAEGNWTSTASTRNGFMGLWTSYEGTPQERVRITKDGFVGVGTTDPKNKMHIAGNLRVNGYIYHNGLSKLRTVNRFELIEQFTKAPKLNADIQNSAEATRMIANTDFEVNGHNATSSLSVLDIGGGVKLTTAGSSDTDSTTIIPHQDGNQSAWSHTRWASAQSLSWSCLIKTGSSIANCWIKAGLSDNPTGLTTGDISGRDDQCYFFMTASDIGNTSYLSDFSKVYFVYSIGGADWVTELDGLPFTADTSYHLSIDMDSDRKITITVNGISYGLANTAALTGARDYGATGCLVNHPSAGTYGTTGSETTIAVDGTSATTVFTAGDKLMDNSGNVYGSIKSVDSATSITMNSITTAMPNNADLHLQGALAINTTDKSDALTSVADLNPGVGIGIDDQSTTTARHMYVYNMNFSKLI